MKLLLIALACLATSVALPQPNQKRDILPGDPRYENGHDHHHHHHHHHEATVEDSRTVVAHASPAINEVYGPPGYQPGIPLNGDYLPPIHGNGRVSEHLVKSSPDLVHVGLKKTITSTVLPQVVEKTQQVVSTVPSTSYGVPIGRTLKVSVPQVSIDTASHAHVKTDLHTTKTEISTPAVKIVEQTPVVQGLTTVTGAVGAVSPFATIGTKNVIGSTLLNDEWANLRTTYGSPSFDYYSQYPSTFYSAPQTSFDTYSSGLGSLDVNYGGYLSQPLPLSLPFAKGFPTGYSLPQTLAIPKTAAPVPLPLTRYVQQAEPLGAVQSLSTVSAVETVSTAHPVHHVESTLPVEAGHQVESVAVEPVHPVHAAKTLAPLTTAHTVKSLAPVHPVHHLEGPTTVEPIHHVETVQPAHHVQHVETVQSVEPVHSVKTVVQPLPTLKTLTPVHPGHHLEGPTTVGPIHHVETVQPAHHVQHVETVQSVEPVHSVKTVVQPLPTLKTLTPVHPGHHLEGPTTVGPIHHVETVQPAHHVQHVETVQSVEPIHSVKTVVQPLPTLKTLTPVHPGHHLEGPTTVGPIHHVETVHPAHHGQHVETVQSVEPIHSVKTLTPVQPLHSLKTFAPVTSVHSVKSYTPLPTVHSVNTVASVHPVHHLESSTVQPVHHAESLETLHPAHPVHHVETVKTAGLTPVEPFHPQRTVTVSQPVETKHTITEVVSAKPLSVVEGHVQVTQKGPIQDFIQNLSTAIPSFPSLFNFGAVSSTPAPAVEVSSPTGHIHPGTLDSDTVTVETPLAHQEHLAKSVVTSGNDYVQPTDANGGYIY